ncbi:MAG: hypothetical protein GY953_54090, partial [bacterium]|nr:hypothetical protein [bacterium]
MTKRIGLLTALLVPACLTAQIGLRIELGAAGERADWEGELRVSSGTIDRLELWEGGNKDLADGARFRIARARRGQLARVNPQLFLTVSAPAT